MTKLCASAEAKISTSCANLWYKCTYGQHKQKKPQTVHNVFFFPMEKVGSLEIIPFPGVITEVVVMLKGGLLQTNILESFE